MYIFCQPYFVDAYKISGFYQNNAPCYATASDYRYCPQMWRHIESPMQMQCVSTKIILVLQPCPPLSALKYNILEMEQHNPTPQSRYGRWGPILSPCMAFPAHLHLSSSLSLSWGTSCLLFPLVLPSAQWPSDLLSWIMASCCLIHSLPPSLSPPSPVYQPSPSCGSHPLCPCHLLVSPWQEPTTDVGWDMHDWNREILRSAQLPRGEEGSSRFTQEGISSYFELLICCVRCANCKAFVRAYNLVFRAFFWKAGFLSMKQRFELLLQGALTLERFKEKPLTPETLKMFDQSNTFAQPFPWKHLMASVNIFQNNLL